MPFNGTLDIGYLGSGGQALDEESAAVECLAHQLHQRVGGARGWAARGRARLAGRCCAQLSRRTGASSAGLIRGLTSLARL